MIDKGANFVILQHSHCINCEEDYKNGKIIYGQGNFVFEWRDSECWKTSLLITIDINGDDFKIGYVPLDRRNGIIEINNTVEILDAYFKRSQEIKDDKFVEDMYYDWGRQRICNFTNLAIGSRTNKWVNHIVQKINDSYGNKLLLQDDRSRVPLINYFNNPAHYELFLNVLKQYPIKDAEWKKNHKLDEE